MAVNPTEFGSAELGSHPVMLLSLRRIEFIR